LPLSAGTHPNFTPVRNLKAVAFVAVAIAVGVCWLTWQSKLPHVASAAPDPGWLPAHPSNRWQCLVIHHSASDIGGAQRFDKWHRAKGWDGLGYDFVIGNGSDTPDGKVEVGYRWGGQEQGAHCKTPDQYYNQHGIGICLVGNFDNYSPSTAQLNSLTRLCRFLCGQFHIPPSQIFTHGGITGKTDCPGKNFDVEKVRETVGSRSS
jgi:hypothetical protein